MAYEKFEETVRQRGSPMVSILKQGLLSINQSCYEELLKKCKFVELYFDAEAKKIGIMPIDTATGTSRPVRTHTNGRIHNITAIGFLNHYKIPYEKSKSCTCTWNAKQKMLEVFLKD